MERSNNGPFLPGTLRNQTGVGPEPVRFAAKKLGLPGSVQPRDGARTLPMPSISAPKLNPTPVVRSTAMPTALPSQTGLPIDGTIHRAVARRRLAGPGP